MSKFKKLSKVHMLPTEDIKHAPIFLASNGVINTRINVHSHHLENRIPQHLHVTSDEKAEEGDWVIHPKHGLRRVIPYDGYKGDGKEKCTVEAANAFHRKVIATTDPKLRTTERSQFNTFTKALSQIPQSFIEEYCKAGGIGEVLVEYINSRTKDSRELTWDENGLCDEWILKTDSNNTIVIHPVEDKVYSREDMISFAKFSKKHGFGLNCINDNMFNKWIKIKT